MRVAAVRLALRRRTRSLVQLRPLTSGSSDDRRRLRQRLPGGSWQPLLPDGVAGSELSAVLRSPQAAAWRGLQLGFLPRGYPRSVTGSYLPYVAWTSTSLLCGRVQSVLATQAALFTVGLGAGAIPMAAAVQWVLKDGVGSLVAILYAGTVNTRFDSDAKRYRFQSTIAITFADFIAVLMPLAPQHFFLMGSISSATSSVASLAQVSSRARVMSTFARHGNLADCVRAGQTQGKLCNILGTGIGAGISWYVGPDPLQVLALMMPLAALSIYGTYASSQLVVLRSLNVQRTERVFVHMLGDADSSSLPLAKRATPLRALGPEAISEVEAFALPYRSVLHGELMLQPLFTARNVESLDGVLPLLQQAADSWDGLQAGGNAPRRSHSLTGEGGGLAGGEVGRGGDSEIDHDRSTGEGCSKPTGVYGGAADSADSSDNAGRHVIAGDGGWCVEWRSAYVIAARPTPGALPHAPAGARVALWYRHNMLPADRLLAMWHASILRHALSAGWCSAAGGGSSSESSGSASMALGELLQATGAIARDTWEEAHTALREAGWDLESLHLSGDGGSLDVVAAEEVPAVPR